MSTDKIIGCIKRLDVINLCISSHTCYYKLNGLLREKVFKQIKSESEECCIYITNIQPM